MISTQRILNGPGCGGEVCRARVTTDPDIVLFIKSYIHSTIAIVARGIGSEVDNIHIIGFRPRSTQIGTTDKCRPGSVKLNHVHIGCSFEAGLVSSGSNRQGCRFGITSHYQLLIVGDP
ncbi:hypothetical protein D3C72_1059320 [compost metagenome]